VFGLLNCCSAQEKGDVFDWQPCLDLALIGYLLLVTIPFRGPKIPRLRAARKWWQGQKSNAIFFLQNTMAARAQFETRFSNISNTGSFLVGLAFRAKCCNHSGNSSEFIETRLRN
jgi:hypothetical protein